MSEPLESDALIGDCETAALVSRSGAFDWFCWPRFDSAACFAVLPSVLGFAMIVGLRALAIHRHLEMPDWLTHRDEFSS